MSDDPDDQRAVVDADTLVALVEEGAEHLSLAWCHTPRGENWPLLYDDRPTPSPTWMVGGWPAHEKLGPLPREYVHRIAAAPLRCLAPTAAGRLCRRRVGTPGEHCVHHQATP